MADSTDLLAALIADTVAGKLTDSLNEPAIAQIDVLDQLLQSKFQQDSVAANALVAVKQGSKAALEQLIEQLQLAIQQDTQFAAQVQAIV